MPLSPDYLAEFLALSKSADPLPLAPKGAVSLPEPGKPDLLAPNDLLAREAKNQTDPDRFQFDPLPAPGPAARLQLPVDPPAGVARAEYWTAGAARLDPDRIPSRFPAAHWRATVESVQALSAKWGGQLAALNWDSARIFGCHHLAPWQRLDCAGLALLLRDRLVLAVRADLVMLESSGGARLPFRMLPPSYPAETVLLWQLPGAAL